MGGCYYYWILVGEGDNFILMRSSYGSFYCSLGSTSKTGSLNANGD